MTSTEDFQSAAEAFLDLVAQVRVDQWQDPALGSWNVRSLVGHTSRAILTLETYLSAPPAVEDNLPDAEAYYVRVLGEYTDNEAIAARGVAAGDALTPDSGIEFAAALDRGMALIRESGPHRLVAVGDFGIRLEEYLRTRVFELVIHGMDIAKATGLEHGLSDAVIAEVADLSARVAVRKGFGQDILFALTGRRPLPGRFSIL